jgi:GntR family phosphonate transport system transcriptional regulator
MTSHTGRRTTKRARANRSRAAEPAGIALWRRVADGLEQAIAAGTYRAGERLPGEIEIAARFGVHRHTVRRALAELAARGLVRAERGSGTYVETPRLSYPIRKRTRFSEIVGAGGRQPVGRLVEHALSPADGDIARRLAVPPGSLVARLEIVRSVDGLPVSVATTWLPADRVPEAARVYRKTRSMTRTLAQAGIRDYQRRGTWITATTADAADAMHLRMTPGQPLIIVDSIDVTADGQPILATRSRLAANRVELVIES